MTGNGSRTRSSARVTIKDVAKVAGVSPSTVSHTFSGRRVISQSTRERVFAAAESLGYSADPHARSMRTGHSGMVGLVLRPQFAATGAQEVSETFNRLAGAMATECLRQGIGLVHVPDPTQPDYAGLPMDGCIVAHPYASDPVIDLFLARGIPIVCADPDPDRPELPWTVGVDYSTGIQEAFDALRARPGQRVWLLPGSEDNAWNREARRVHAAWCADSAITPEVHVLSEGMTPAQAEKHVTRLIVDDGAPDAIVFSVSKMSEAILRAVAGAGLSAPGDIQLVTLTDSTISRTARPSITALDLNHEALAAAAVALMLGQLAGEEAPAVTPLVRPVLTVRESTDG